MAHVFYSLHEIVSIAKGRSDSPTRSGQSMLAVGVPIPGQVSTDVLNLSSELSHHMLDSGGDITTKMCGMPLLTSFTRVLLMF